LSQAAKTTITLVSKQTATTTAKSLFAFFIVLSPSISVLLLPIFLLGDNPFYFVAFCLVPSDVKRKTPFEFLNNFDRYVSFKTVLPKTYFGSGLLSVAKQPYANNVRLCLLNKKSRNRVKARQLSFAK